MNSVIYICGNDGSGKTTYAKKIINRLEAAGRKVKYCHFYDNGLRKLITFVFNIKGNNIQSRKSSKMEIRTINIFNKNVLKYTYLTYLIILSLYFYIFKIINFKKVIIVDRYFIDEIISFEILFDINYKFTIYKLLYYIFPAEEIIYITAGAKTKFERMDIKDITWDNYLKKEKKYDNIFNKLNYKNIKFIINE